MEKERKKLDNYDNLDTSKLSYTNDTILPGLGNPPQTLRGPAFWQKSISSKVNWAFGQARVFLLRSARALMVGPYVGSSELSYTNTPSYTMETILPVLG